MKSLTKALLVTTIAALSTIGSLYAEPSIYVANATYDKLDIQTTTIQGRVETKNNIPAGGNTGDIRLAPGDCLKWISWKRSGVNQPWLGQAAAGCAGQVRYFINASDYLIAG